VRPTFELIGPNPKKATNGLDFRTRPLSAKSGTVPVLAWSDDGKELIDT
jgi:hypothetical protein